MIIYKVPQIIISFKIAIISHYTTFLRDLHFWQSFKKDPEVTANPKINPLVVLGGITLATIYKIIDSVKDSNT